MYGSITPRSPLPGARSSGRLAARRGASTIGVGVLVSSALPSSLSTTVSSTIARSRAISANGLSLRTLRSRSSRTAAALRASHARWYPPSPLTATIRPAESASAQAWIASSPALPGLPSASSQRTVGPQSGHATGCAWKRRSAGSWYSAAQASHSSNAFIVVRGRSYGSDSMIDQRGPQFVQLMNG